MAYVKRVELGQEYVRSGRRWLAVGFEPYTRKDGTETELAVWQGHCKACNKPFTVRTPAETYLASSGSFDAARCAECKSAGRK